MARGFHRLYTHKTVRDSAALLDLLQVIQPEAAFQTPLYDGSYQEDLAKRTSSMRIAYSVESPSWHEGR